LHPRRPGVSSLGQWLGVCQPEDSCLLNELRAKKLFIERDSPWENGYTESFKGKFQDELLNRELFYTLKETKIIIEHWRREYNQVGPHSA
jgi:putative transposase